MIANEPILVFECRRLTNNELSGYEYDFQCVHLVADKKNTL